MRAILYGFCIIGIMFGQSVHAQFSGDITGQGITIVLSTQYPIPGETITATLDDYALGTGGGSIEWILDGTVLNDAVNQREVTFVAGEVGKPQTISVQLQLSNGGALKAEHIITPLYTDLIVEPQTYTPVFYQGRGMPSFGSTVVLTALIDNGTGQIDPALHTYSWRLNNDTLGGGPIRGGYKTKMVVPHGRSSVITLSVSNAAGTTIARRLIEIPSVEVAVQFYEVSSLFGLSKRAITDDLPLIGNSTTVRAVPYHLDRNAVGSGLFTEWKIDGKKQTGTIKDPFEVTLLRQGTGNSRVSFKIRNLSALIQSDEESFTVEY